MSYWEGMLLWLAAVTALVAAWNAHVANARLAVVELNLAEARALLMTLPEAQKRLAEVQAARDRHAEEVAEMDADDERRARQREEQRRVEYAKYGLVPPGS